MLSTQLESTIMVRYRTDGWEAPVVNQLLKVLNKTRRANFTKGS